VRRGSLIALAVAGLASSSAFGAFSDIQHRMNNATYFAPSKKKGTAAAKRAAKKKRNRK
jgi:hypothetical protein